MKFFRSKIWELWCTQFICSDSQIINFQVWKSFLNHLIQWASLLYGMFRVTLSSNQSYSQILRSQISDPKLNIALDRARQDESFGLNFHIIYQKIRLDELYLAEFTDLYLHSNCQRYLKGKLWPIPSLRGVVENLSCDYLVDVWLEIFT